MSTMSCTPPRGGGSGPMRRRRGRGTAMSGDPERESRLHLHDAALDDGPVRGEQRLRRNEKAVGVVHRAWHAGKLRDHRLEHRFLAEIGLEHAHAAARATAKDELAKADDRGGAPAAEDVDGLVLQALLAAAHVVNRPQAPVRETQRDRPALLAVSGVGRGECADLDRQALCEVDREIDEVADVTEKNSAARNLVLVPAVGWHTCRTHGASDLPHFDPFEVGERALAQGTEAAVVGGPRRPGAPPPRGPPRRARGQAAPPPPEPPLSA